MKKWTAKLNSIDGFAPEQTFFAHRPFFENAERLQNTPDEGIQLLEYKTYLFCILEVWEKGLAKVPSKNLTSVDAFALEQTFFDLLVFGGAFSLVFLYFVPVEVTR